MHDTMRNKIFGWIGVVWGGAIALYAVGKGVSGGSAYAAGSLAGSVFGIAMLIAGGRALTKHRRA